MSSRALIVALALGWSASASAIDADISLGEESAKFYFSSFIGGHQHGRTMASGGFFYNSDDDRVLDLGLHAMDITGTKTPGLLAGVGGRVYLGTVSDEDVLGLALGGHVSYRPPQAKRLSFEVNGHYAPDIVTTLDAERFYELGARIGYSVLPQAEIFLGYRYIAMEVDGDSTSADDGGHLGLRINF